MTKPEFKGYLRGFLVALAWFYPAPAQHEIKTVDGLNVMLAVSSAEDMKTRRSKEFPELKMFGGPRGTHYILVHIEDEKAGKIITDVSVSLAVHNPDGTMVRKDLESMTINELTDFGNYFDLSDLGNYHMDVFITPREGKAKKVSFVYERRPGHRVRLFT